MLEILTSLFSQGSLTKLLDQAVDQELLAKLVEKIDGNTIYVICLTILAMKSNDSGIQKTAIETIGKMSNKES